MRNQKADAFIRGTYGDEYKGAKIFKGCSVGCALESVSRLKGLTLNFGDHSQFEPLLGIPEWLARLNDKLFEGMSLENSKSWPVDFSDAIQDGANLESVKHKFMAVVLRHAVLSMDSVVFEKENWPDVVKALALSKDAVNSMIALHDAESKDEAAWAAARAAAGAAWAAARAAALGAEAAAGAAAWAAARAAALGAEAAAALGAALGAEAAAGAAKKNAYDFYADELLKILKKTTDN